jgi:tRNA threonylcarbamoyladenosine biosynthesis protein TsaB
MNLVAIETATETVAVAVRTGDGVQAELAVGGRRRHVESLTPALEHLLGQVGLVPGDLTAIAVDVGPGLFTGLRVGVAAAKGLAQALGIGVIGLTSLEILTAAAAGNGLRGHVLAAVDARRGEVFASLAHVGADGQVTETRPAQLLSPDGAVASLADLDGQPLFAIGDGAQRYAGVLGSVPGLTVVSPGLSWPPPATLLDLAAGRLATGAAQAGPSAVVPLYMREADAISNFVQVSRG